MPARKNVPARFLRFCCVLLALFGCVGTLLAAASAAPASMDRKASDSAGNERGCIAEDFPHEYGVCSGSAAIGYDAAAKVRLCTAAYSGISANESEILTAAPKETGRTDRENRVLRISIAFCAAAGAVCAVCLRKRKSRFILASLAVLIAAVFALSFWSSPPAVPSGGAETEGTLAAAEEVSAGAEPEASPAVAEEASAGAEPEASPAAGEEASAGAEPTASPSAYDLVTSLRLTEDDPAEVRDLLNYQNLRYVDATACTCYDELLAVQAAMPDCEIEWTVGLGPMRVSSLEETLDLDGAGLADGALCAEKLRYLPKLREVSLIGSGLTEKQMGEVANILPEIRFIRMISFGRWTVRSDITCFSTLLSDTVYREYSTEDFLPLFASCTDLVALDLGHNKLADLTPLSNLKKLKILILADNAGITDISPLGELTELEYLEFFLNRKVTDFSPLARCTHLTHLNLCYCSIGDPSFMSALPDLRMVWLLGSGITAQQAETLRAEHPGAEFLFPSLYVTSSTGSGWRAAEENIAIRKALTNWVYVVDFKDWDDVTYAEGAKLAEVGPSYA